MEPNRALARWRLRLLPAGRVTTRFALLGVGLFAAAACRDVDRTVGLAPAPGLANLSESGSGDEETTQPIGAEASYTSSMSMSSSRAGGLSLASLAPSLSIAGAADPRTIVRVYKDHDAWRTNPDGGRDEATLVSMGMVKGSDFFVEPMSALASGIPAATRAVIITANSRGAAATSEAQRSAAAQAALGAFLQTGGTVILDLADNEIDNGYVTPGSTGTPLRALPSNCSDATLTADALGGDGLIGTADDHPFVRGPDGVAGTADDMDNVKIDLARGGSDEQEEQNTDPDLSRSSCSIAHGALDLGMTLPSKARVLATATWDEAQRPVLAEYCHAGGRVIVNTFTLGYYDHKPREGSAVPIRMSWIQRNLFAYAVSAETYCNKAPTIVAPADIKVPTDGGMCSAAISLGEASIDDDAEGVKVESQRSDGAALDAAYPAGVTSITWTATDAEGEIATATQTVTVEDMEKPVVTVSASKTVNNDPGLASARVDVGPASATDNCASSVAITGTRSDGRALGDAYGVGTTTITWTARDEAGNEASAEQLITVVDAEAPFVVVPASFVVNATAPAGATVSYNSSASDNVGISSWSCSRQSGNVFPIGRNVVTCIAMDAAGNSTAREFTVLVLGAPEQIVNLIEYVKGAIVNSTYRTALIDYLKKVLSYPRGTAVTCRALDYFIAAVRAKSGTSISVAKANRMIADATRIKAVLACP
jgi:hypothetical protein